MPTLKDSVMLACTLFLSFSNVLRATGQSEKRGPTGVLASTFIEVTDETGRRVRVAQPVERIVSLAPSLTELVFALGAGDRLVGDTDFCDYPPEALTKPKVGGAINPSIEQIVAFRPDLVLMTKTLNRRETVLTLEQLGIVPYATDPRTVESVLGSFGRLGDVIGERETGRRLEETSRSRLNELRRRIGTRAARRVLFIVWLDPFITIGRNTFIADALRWAGARSVVTTAKDWPQISLEEIVHLQPEYLIFAAAHEESLEQSLKELEALPGWRSLEAVRNKRIAIVSDAIDRPSPRIVGAIEELARQLHPGAFKETKETIEPGIRPSKDSSKNAPAHLSSPMIPGDCFSCAR